MPRQSATKHADYVTVGRKAPMKPRIAANGNKLPDPLPPGEILTDVRKKQWKLGKSIGVGGFGEIYLATDDISKRKVEAKYVIKVERHSNGPLFCEMHFYYRVGKPEDIDTWIHEKKLKFLGMPRLIASGSHEHRGVKYRFMVLARFGEDLQKLLERNNRIFPVKTVYTLGIKILHVLEYVHSRGYIHGDIKASNLTSGFGKSNENQVHLIDFGLACKFIANHTGAHKECKEDIRKAHDGTIEYTSRDAHIGAHSRRGDLEILGYNMLHWLSGYLPWEDNLKDNDHVSTQKNLYMSNIPALMKRCFPFPSSPPAGIEKYLRYVVDLKFDEEPNYAHCCEILSSAIKLCGFKNDGKLVYISERSSYQMSRKRPAPRDSLSPPRKMRRSDLGQIVLRKMASVNYGMPATPCKKVRRVASATPRLQTTKTKEPAKEPQISDCIPIVDNPTPAILDVIERKYKQIQQLAQLAKGKNGIATHGKNGLSKNGIIKEKLAKFRASAVTMQRTMETKEATKEPLNSNYISAIENPTPAMMLVIKSKLQQQAKLVKRKNGILTPGKNGLSKNNIIPGKISKFEILSVNNHGGKIKCVVPRMQKGRSYSLKSTIRAPTIKAKRKIAGLSRFKL